MTQQTTVGVDGLLEEIAGEIAEAAAQIDLMALMRLAHAQGERAGVLRAVRYSQSQAERARAAQRVGPVVEEEQPPPPFVEGPTPVADEPISTNGARSKGERKK